MRLELSIFQFLCHILTHCATLFNPVMPFFVLQSRMSSLLMVFFFVVVVFFEITKAFKTHGFFFRNSQKWSPYGVFLFPLKSFCKILEVSKDFEKSF